MHRLTIGRMSRRRRCPRIHIQGVWLRELGWEVGDKVEVIEDRKELVVRKLFVETPGQFEQLKLPQLEEVNQDEVPSVHQV